MIEISKNLYLGSQEDALRVSRTKEVDAIVYLGQELPTKLSFNSQIPVFHIPLKDGEGNFKLSITETLLLVSYLTLEDKTLVACRAGLSRSSAIIAGCIVFSNSGKYSFDKALSIVKSKAPAIMPELHLLADIKTVVEELEN